jgi:hypothetical protein
MKPMPSVFPSVSTMACLAVVVASAWVPVGARANILVTAEAPGVQSSQVTGVTTMNFNSNAVGTYTTLSSPIGTYTSPGLAIVAADAFGGANATQYMAIGAQSGTLTATLTLNQSAANYFGLFWMAGDSQNNLEFFKGTTLVASLNIATITSYLTSNPAYYGNPNNGQDTSEPFIYLNFYGQNGTTFNKIVFQNIDLSTGYETDNHSIATLTGSYTPSGTPITRIGAPEPSSWAIGILVATAAGWVAWRGRGTGLPALPTTRTADGLSGRRAQVTAPTDAGTGG